MPGRPTRRHPLRLLVAVAALAGALGLAPATLPSAAAPGAPVAPVAPAAPAAALPPPFTGTVAEFYEVPDPLPPGERGEIIRMQAVSAGAERTGWRVMYHTVDEAGRDRAVTGVITLPNAAPPVGGWPVVAHAHGTTGINERCAPSRGPSLPGWFGIEGVWVQTDYLGLGPVGELHPYLQRAAESNAVLDSVRAAHEIAGAELSDDWFLVGGSQGGHAALAANEDAATDLPEYRLLGTVAMVPGAEMTRTFDDRAQVQIIMAFAVFGNSQERPDLDPADLLTPEAHAALVGPMTTQCANEGILAALPFAATGTLFRSDPEQNPLFADYRERNEVGRRVGASPVFVVGGVKDITVVIARVRALRASLCAIGQPHTYVEVPEGTHNTAGTIAGPEAIAWLQARAAGEPLTSTPCGGEPTTTTSTTPTGATTTTAGTSTARTPGTAAPATPVRARPAYTG
mgnify:CR=1 FL=1